MNIWPALLTAADLLSSRINAMQVLGCPLYLINKDYYYAFMAWTKQCFGLFMTTICQWWSPTTVRISGDSSVSGQLRQTPDGRLECAFPERIVLLANHQVSDVKAYVVSSKMI